MITLMKITHAFRGRNGCHRRGAFTALGIFGMESRYAAMGAFAADFKTRRKGKLSKMAWAKRPFSLKPGLSRRF